MLLEHAVHHFTVQGPSGGAQAGGQVLLVFEKIPAVGGTVQIPGSAGQPIRHVGLEGGQIPARPLEAVHDLVFSQALDGAGRGRQGGGQDEPCGVGCVAIAMRLDSDEMF